MSTVSQQIMNLISKSRKTGLTRREVEDRTEFGHNTVSPVIVQLESAGRIVRTQRTRKSTNSTRPAAVYVAPKYATA